MSRKVKDERDDDTLFGTDDRSQIDVSCPFSFALRSSTDKVHLAKNSSLARIKLNLLTLSIVLMCIPMHHFA